MADIKEAVDFVLHQEDSRLSGAITTLPGDRGGPTRFGIASRFHPDLVDQGFFDSDGESPKIPNDDALAIAEHVYEEECASGLRLADIESQDVADRLLSFAINEGHAEAVAIAQRACGLLGQAIQDDGKMGPATVAAINACDPAAWLAANRTMQEAFYRHLVAVRPELLPELKGLLNRADA